VLQQPLLAVVGVLIVVALAAEWHAARRAKSAATR
jgi:hypothetical protein